MRPAPLRIGSLEVPPYPLLLYLAIVAGLAVQNEAAGRAGIDTTAVFAVSAVAMAAALAGAKLWYLVEHASPWRGLRSGGMCLTGGLAGGIASGLLLGAAIGLPLGHFLDGSAAGLCIGLAIARVGCWLSGCCAGRPTAAPWGVRSRNALGQWSRRVPTQALEGVWAAALAAAVLAIPDLPGGGRTFAAAVAAYLAGRQFLLPLRDLRRPRAVRDRALGGAALLMALLAAIA